MGHSRKGRESQLMTKRSGSQDATSFQTRIFQSQLCSRLLQESAGIHHSLADLLGMTCLAAGALALILQSWD